MSRKLEIFENDEKNDQREFLNGSSGYDDKDVLQIKCAFNLEQACSPDCAACDINTNTTTVRCLRMGEDFGYIPSS